MLIIKSTYGSVDSQRVFRDVIVFTGIPHRLDAKLACGESQLERLTTYP